ncbi:restriction endonuclease [Anaeromyxobacter sp. PSR-1]|uniref:restriction endonuclease n=1 Tax=Anaeromyxobacter sp. PSR-1 TaxID=1300915 RepID=UPI0005DC9E01|nr:restriction endonuclease [Anaeromyxobacter sp. PSR-1]GAO05131.1 restriction endonuclease [Anaeromyxobacter sp. PSR-1]
MDKRENPTDELAGALDPATLVSVVRDLLVLHGHHDIRITDGPGDGGRDIHSLTTRGDKHLVQCKYHRDSSAACSSAEAGELPKAMIKLGYRHSLFVTNARMSPQAKREYLDDYPGFHLDYIEGEGLLRELLGDTLLSALWLDGEKISRNRFTLALEVIVRRHADDASLLPFRVCREDWALPSVLFLRERHPKCVFRVHEAVVAAEAFEPYRAPEPPTAEEPSHSPMWGTAFMCDGLESLDEVHSVSRDVALAVILAMSKSFQGFTVRVGRPEIVPLRGERKGARIRTEEFDPVSVVSTEASCGVEADWYSAHVSEHWSGDTDARVTEGPWIRLYAKDQDACLAAEIHSALTLRERTLQASVRDIQLTKWSQSVFCLSAPWRHWALSAVPPPNETAVITRLGRQMSGWFHKDLLGGPVPMRTADPELPHPFADRSEDAPRLQAIRRALENAQGVELIDPSEARYLLAANGHDPLPEIRRKTFHTGEVLSFLDEMPSPILPQSRRFTLTTAWRYGTELATVEEAAAWACHVAQPELATRCEVEDDEGYAVVNVSLFREEFRNRPTYVLVEEAYSWTRQFIAAVQEYLRGRAQLSTFEYWRKSHNVTLGVPFSGSDKPWMWGEEAPGVWVPIATGKNLPGPEQ